MRLLKLLLVVIATSSFAQTYTDVRPVYFTHSNQWFNALSYDSGWWPSSSPIQVRFTGNMGSGTQVSAPGNMALEWGSTGRKLRATGNADSGDWSVDLGVDFESYLNIDFTLPTGQWIHWQGKLPGFPDLNYRLADEKTFTPFLFSGANPTQVELWAKSALKQLLSISLTKAIIPIPGISGNLDFNVGAELKAQMQGERMITSLGDITTDNGYAAWNVPESTKLPVSVQYESVVTSQPRVDFQPAVSIHIGPYSKTLFKFTLPVSLPSKTDHWTFNQEQLSFDLPRLDVEIANTAADGGMSSMQALTTPMVDFGTGIAGESTSRTLVFTNVGSGTLVAQLAITGAGFSGDVDSVLALAVGEVQTRALSLSRPGVGDFLGEATVVSNDPRGPVTLALTGVATMPADAGTHRVPIDDTTPTQLSNGCGCNGTPVGSLVAGFMVVAGLWSRRRRQA